MPGARPFESVCWWAEHELILKTAISQAPYLMPRTNSFEASVGFQVWEGKSTGLLLLKPRQAQIRSFLLPKMGKGIRHSRRSLLIRSPRRIC